MKQILIISILLCSIGLMAQTKADSITVELPTTVEKQLIDIETKIKELQEDQKKLIETIMAFGKVDPDRVKNLVYQHGKLIFITK